MQMIVQNRKLIERNIAIVCKECFKVSMNFSVVACVELEDYYLLGHCWNISTRRYPQ